MFVIVRDDLKTVGLKAAQGAHALAQHLIDYPNTQWKNNTLIFLKTENIYTLYNIVDFLELKNKKYSTFYEPDLNNELTAIAVYSERDNKFKKLKLL